jgi:hypothetical protein
VISRNTGSFLAVSESLSSIRCELRLRICAVDTDRPHTMLSRHVTDGDAPWICGGHKSFEPLLHDTEASGLAAKITRTPFDMCQGKHNTRPQTNVTPCHNTVMVQKSYSEASKVTRRAPAIS